MPSVYLSNKSWVYVSFSTSLSLQLEFRCCIDRLKSQPIGDIRSEKSVASDWRGPGESQVCNKRLCQGQALVRQMPHRAIRCASTQQHLEHRFAMTVEQTSSFGLTIQDHFRRSRLHDGSLDRRLHRPLLVIFIMYKSSI